MSNRIERCHCGHAKETHHRDDRGRYRACLGMGCNVPSRDWDSTKLTDPCPYYRDCLEKDPLT